MERGEPSPTQEHALGYNKHDFDQTRTVTHLDLCILYYIFKRKGTFLFLKQKTSCTSFAGQTNILRFWLSVVNYFWSFDKETPFTVAKYVSSL